MRGVVAFMPASGRRQAVAGGGFIRIDAADQLLQVVGCEQLAGRIGDEVGIAEQAAVTVGAAQRFDDIMRTLHRLGLAPG
ncbi:hypothetical protein FQZ97_1090180 [compost metagenome]